MFIGEIGQSDAIQCQVIGALHLNGVPTPRLAVFWLSGAYSCRLEVSVSLYQLFFGLDLVLF